MWTIGWRKSQTSGKMIERYIVDSDGIIKHATCFLDNIVDGITSGNIIHNMFYSIANLAIKSANKLLKSLNMPAFHNPSLKPSPSRLDFASNLAFTQNEFSNRPHQDKDDSKTAFLLLCNTNQHTGSLSLGVDQTFTGPLFFFPDHGVAVDLRKLNGICRIVFDAGQFRHFTHNNQPPHPYLTSFGFSLQICKSCVDAFKSMCSNFYVGKKPKKGDEYFVSDVDHIVKKHAINK